MTRTNYALIFYLGSLVLGLGYGAIGSFTFLLLRAIGDAGRMMGLSLLVGCVTEVTCFLVADKAIARLGHLAVMTGCVLLMGVRMLGLAALQHPSQVLLVETLAGPIFALGWTAGVTFSRQIAPEGHGATMIGIYTGLKFGVGCGLGSLLAGPLTNSLGLRGMFVVLGVFSMLVAAAMVVAAVVAERVGVLGVGAGMPGPSGSRAKWSHEQHQWFELEDRAEGTLLGWRPEEGGGEGEKAAAGAVTKCSEIKPEV
jgi:MFS family permease